MTTTTEDRVREENLVDAAARAAESGAKTLATIEPEQQRFTEQQVAILRQLGIENATQGDLDLFFHYCRTTGLDPFRRQIYMIGRNTKVVEWVDQPSGARTKVENWVTKYTIQTGIDGYRRNGREAAKRLGDSLRFEGPFWCGEDGEWREVWPASTPPTAAKYTIYRNGEPFSAVVHYDEFVQTNAVYEGEGRARRKVGEEPNCMWAKMPRNQTAKCAEAMAWRRAYPDDFSGIDLEDAAQPTVIDQDGNVESGPAEKPKPRRGGRGAGGLRDRAAAAQKQDKTTVVTEEEKPVGAGDTAVADTQVENTTAGADRAEPGESNSGMRKAVENRLFKMISTLHEQVGGDRLSRDERIALYRAVLKRSDITSTNDLDNVEVSAVADQLFRWAQAGKLADEIAEIRNLAALDAAADADAEQGSAE